MAGAGEMEDLLRGALRGVAVARVPTGEVPEPYHGLLCHEHDMTSTLSRYHGGEVALRVFSEEGGEETYQREVLLTVGEKAVEYGVIRIFLENFPGELRAEICRGKQPLGALLNASGLGYFSRPLAFLRIRSEDFQPDFFPASDSKFLFGRYNQLIGSGNFVLARIIEILPNEAP